MNAVESLLAALHADPTDDTAWLALADALEEAGENDRAELLRLHRSLRGKLKARQRTSNEKKLQKLLAKGVKPCVPVVVNSIGLELALIQPGVFQMGSPEDEPERMECEVLHEVEITKPFYLGVYPVTQEEYQRVMKKNPSEFKGAPRNPVEKVLWRDAAQFCERSSALPQDKKAGRVYRLPSEAEWEYACRAWLGPANVFHFGATLDGTQANFDGRLPYGRESWGDHDEAGIYLGRTAPVGNYPPNAFGLYDMHGNVDEWVQDWDSSDYYTKGPRVDPPGPKSGASHIVRGGSWGAQGEDCRAAVRIGLASRSRADNVGFRVAMTVARR